MGLVPFKGRSVDRSRTVDVYRNLRTGRHGLPWSVRQDGLVVAHADILILVDCVFVIREAGRERCRRTGQRNVHAWVTGGIYSGRIKFNDPTQVKYDPRNRSGLFERMDQVMVPYLNCRGPLITTYEPIHEARAVGFSDHCVAWSAQ
jgi:hypothetical protein